MVLNRIRSLPELRIRVQDSFDSGKRFGHSGDSDQAPTIHVHNPAFYWRAVIHGSLGFAESYRRGEWDSTDLVSLFRSFARNLHLLNRFGSLSGIVHRPIRLMQNWSKRNTRSGSKKNIEAHYDLSNDFFQLMLDKTMTYSSAVFCRPDMSLEEAQIEKYDRICRMLNVQPGDRLVEIGTGWGGFAEYAAVHYDCHVTTTTISEKQYQFVQTRIRDRQLEGRIRLVNQDYRELGGQFDKLVSIEMVEAVGHQYLDKYFEKCSRLLKPSGTMCLQVITIPDQRYERYRRSIDFIQRYIFPGGCLPSFSAITQSIAKCTDFRLLGSQDFAFDYARTLSCWRSNFWKNIQGVRELGFSDQWIRTWDYYLCYCIAGFLERQIGVSQIVLAKPHAHQGMQPFHSQHLPTNR